MRFLLLLCLVSVPAFSGAKNARYVFSLLDTNFVVKARIESSIQSSQDPDTSEVKRAAESVSTWQLPRLNSKPMGDVWLAYEPPADPGSIILVSNTTPSIPLLRLNIDAMCGGCFHAYSHFGNVSVPVDTVTDGRKLDIVTLENDFQLGKPLDNEERKRIAEKIDDYSLSMPRIPSVTVYVLKIESGLSKNFPSMDGILYIAYFSIVEPTVSIAEGEFKLSPRVLPQQRFDVLGRSSKRLFPLRVWRANYSDHR